MMKQKQSSSLKELVQALDQPDFNLEAWKIKAVLVLKSIFGSSDDKIQYIEHLQYDYSSWKLRDSSGGKIVDPVKQAAREIIHSALSELETEHSTSAILELFRQELTGNQFNMLSEILKSDEQDEKALSVFIADLSPDTARRILVQALLTR